MILRRLSESSLQNVAKPLQVLLTQQRGIKPWEVEQPGAKNVKFAYNGSAARFWRYFIWQYCWQGREYGLLFHDQAFEPDPIVAEALRRLNMKEPWVFDARKIRLIKAHNMAMHHEKLPKSEWTKWEDETFYLKPYMDEIKAEIKAREDSESFSLLPRFLRRN